MKNNRTTLVFALSTVFLSNLYAQEPQNAARVGERIRDTLDYYEFQKKIETPEDNSPDQQSIIDDTLIDDGETEEPNAALADTKILVSQIVVGDSEIITPEEMAQIVSSYKNVELSIAEIFSILDEINQLYKEKGFLSAKAVLPPQKVEQGIVTIDLIEGHVGDVIVENNISTAERFITKRISSGKGQLVDLDTLGKELFYFNSVNDIKIRAVLKPGAEFATTDYLFQTQEPQKDYTTFYVDNSGTSDTGKRSAGFSYVNNSLSGNRDVLTLGSSLTDGVKAAFFSYNAPVGIRGSRLGLSMDYSELEILDGSLEELNITGASHNIGASFSHPIVVKPDLLLKTFIGLNGKKSSTDFDGFTAFNTNISAASLGVDIQYSRPWGPLYSRHYLTSSKRDFLGADESYTKFNAEFSQIINMDAGVQLLLRFSGQYTDDELLPSAEQFQGGGMSTVRGYPSGLLSGDTGFFTSAEFSFPVTRLNDDNSQSGFADSWRGLMFFDRAGVFPFKGNDEDKDSSDYISSVGVGLNMRMSNALSARVVFALPTKIREDGEDDAAVHFYISYTAF